MRVRGKAQHLNKGVRGPVPGRLIREDANNEVGSWNNMRLYKIQR
jgi:hypothetical protein